MTRDVYSQTISPGPGSTNIWKDTALEGLNNEISMLSAEDVTEAVVDTLSASSTSQARI